MISNRSTWMAVLIATMTVTLGAKNGVSLKNDSPDAYKSLRATDVAWVGNGNFAAVSFMAPGEQNTHGRLSLIRLNFQNRAMPEQILDFGQEKFSSLATFTFNGEEFIVTGGNEKEKGAKISWFKVEKNQLVPIHVLHLPEKMVEGIQVSAEGIQKHVDVFVGAPKKKCRLTLFGDTLQNCRPMKVVDAAGAGSTGGNAYGDLDSKSLAMIQDWNSNHESASIKGWNVDPSNKLIRVAYVDENQDVHQMHFTWLKAQEVHAEKQLHSPLDTRKISM